MADTDETLCKQVPNTASVVWTNKGTDEATDTTEVLCPEIVIEKTADDASVNAGDPIGFTVTITNTGAGDAYKTTVSDTLPAGFAWTIESQVPAASWSIGGGSLSFGPATLAAGASATVHIVADTDETLCKQVPNTASVVWTNKGTDEATDTTEVLCPEIVIEKTADDASVNAGDPIGFTVTITNTGAGDAYKTTVSDTLPAGFAWTIESQVPAASWSIGGGSLSFGPATLAAGASATVHIVADTDETLCKQVPNTASVVWTNKGTDEATDTTEVLCPDVKVTKDGNGPLKAGDVATFTITVENLGPGIARDVKLTDQLPEGANWASPAGCTISATGLLECKFAEVKPGAAFARTITISGETTAVACADLPNLARAEAGNEPQDEVTLANNSDGATIIVDCPALVITKTADTSTVSAGDAIGFTIEVTSNGPDVAKSVVVTDNLPLANPGVLWKIDGGTGAAMCAIASGTLTCAFGDMPAQMSYTVHISRMTDASICSTVPNTAVATYTDGQDDDDAVVEIQCPDVTISKTADNSPIIAGQTASYTISAWNLGPGTAYGVVITDKVPTGVAWAVDNEDCSIVNGTLTCQVGTLAKGDAPFTVKLTGSTARANCGDLPNEAAVSATNEATGATGNNRDDASIAVLCPSASISKTNDAEGKQAPGATVGYTLTLSVVNGPISTMTVKDVLPANFGTPSAISDGGTYDAATRTITWTLANVANGKQLTYDVVIATATQGGSYTNIATITEGPCVAGACEDTSVVPVWRVAIDKTNDTTKPLLEGEDVVYTLTFAVQNGPITSMVVTDTLPAEVVNPRNFSVAPVSVVGQVITWNLKDVADGATITYTASIAAGTATGSYKNVAVITQGPCVGDECTDDSVVNTAAGRGSDRNPQDHAAPDGHAAQRVRPDRHQLPPHPVCDHRPRGGAGGRDPHPGAGPTAGPPRVARGGSACRPPGIDPAGRRACRNQPWGPRDPDGTCRA